MYFYFQGNNDIRHRHQTTRTPGWMDRAIGGRDGTTEQTRLNHHRLAICVQCVMLFHPPQITHKKINNNHNNDGWCNCTIKINSLRSLLCVQWYCVCCRALCCAAVLVQWWWADARRWLTADYIPSPFHHHTTPKSEWNERECLNTLTLADGCKGIRIRGEDLEPENIFTWKYIWMHFVDKTSKKLV